MPQQTQGWGFSLTYSLLFESTALNGAGVRFVEYARADEAED